MNRRPNANPSARPSADPSFDEPIIDPPLLDLLLEASSPVTIESLSKAQGWPIGRVQQELARLEAANCRIQRHPQHGVALTHCGLGAWVDYLRWTHPNKLSQTPPRLIEIYRRTTSTQDVAKRLIAARGPSVDRAIVIADEQTDGRGRLGRRWIAPPGTAVTFSRIAAAPQDSAQQSINRVTLAAAVAVAQALDPLIQPASVEIKWPNDLLVHGAKLAGILVETSTSPIDPNQRLAIIGIGINITLTPQQIPEPGTLNRPMTSLAMLNRPAHRLSVISRVIKHLDQTLDQADPTPLLDQWRRRCPRPTTRSRFQNDGCVVEGQVIDLDPTQGLIVRTDNGAIVHLPAATTSVLD